MANPDYNVIYPQQPFNKTLEDNAAPSSLKTGDGGGTSDSMDKERLAKLEGAFDGLRSNQTILMSAVGIASALLIGLASFTILQNIGINARVNELPGKISSDLRDITKTLSEAITASKQQVPQVILLPAPQPPSPTPPKSDQK